MSPLFIDTGAFLARYLHADQHHASALRGWAQIERTRARCFTSNFVLDEVLTLLGRRAGSSFAAERGRAWYESRTLHILRPDAETETQALELLEKFSDQPISFTDCVSFVLMRSQGLEHVFGFDRHFEAAGFQLFPR